MDAWTFRAGLARCADEKNLTFWVRIGIAMNVESVCKSVNSWLAARADDPATEQIQQSQVLVNIVKTEIKL